MKENKVLLIKTRGGKIMRILREHYLRDDIEHGIGNELDKLPSNNKPNKFCKTNYWILPDTNIFLNNIDAIEQTQFSNMIILQTVQNELKRRSAPNYKRLKTLLSSGRKSFVFVNEFAKGLNISTPVMILIMILETFANRVKGESSNDYNDRLIRRACKYYNEKGLNENLILQ